MYNGTSYYYCKNLQGDVISILDANGNTVVSYVYDSWGKVLSVSGSEADGIGYLNPIRYRGYYYDIETGLYYLNSRYYISEYHRFLNADGLTNREGSYYSYCNNNPVNLSDSTGCSPWFDWFAGILTGSLAIVAIISGFILTGSGGGSPLGAALFGIGIGMAIGGASGGITAALHGDNVGVGIFAGALVGGVLGATGTLGALAETGILTEGAAFAGFGISVGTCFAAGMGRYTINTIANNRNFNVGKMFLDGGLTAIEGAIGFGMGAAFAGAGAWKKINGLKGSSVNFSGGGKALNLATIGIRSYFTNAFAKGITWPFRYAFL